VVDLTQQAAGLPQKAQILKTDSADLSFLCFFVAKFLSTRSVRPPNMIYFLVPAAQDNLIKDYLEVCRAALRNDFRVVHYENLLDQKEFRRGTYVLSALDQLSPGMTDLLTEIHQQLKDVPGIRFLNNPVKTLQRFPLLIELHRRGMNEFRAARAGEAHYDLRFPVFLRNERLHEGSLSPLMNSEREIRQAVGRALIQGHKLSELLVVEFCDTASEAGYYRKYGAYIVGKRVIPGSFNCGRHWMLKHSPTEFTLAMVREELDYVSQNPHQEQLLNIFELAHVDYGRIDYSIKNGKVQTWEINLYPTIGRESRPGSKTMAPELQAICDEIRYCFYQGLDRAWKEVMLPGDDLDPIAVEVDSSITQAARTPVVRESRLLSAIRAILRPGKPLIEPLSPPFLRILAWLTRLFRR
jgi:hypothetical protein